MKEAARASVQEGVELWRGRAGEFSWDVSWFNDFLFHQLGGWSPDDLSSIPAPALDAATSLYAGVEFMAGEMLEAYQAGTAAGSRDHHVMVVLSDGADNLSELDNSQVDPVSQTTQSGAEYLRFGWPSTELADAVAAVRAHPRLTVHVLAMGSNFAEGDLENLTKLADAGNGQLLENPEAGEIGSLFGRVTKEFSTLQTRGASIPQQSGKHTFTVEVTGTGSGERGSTSFRYQAGPEARVLE